MIIIIHIMIVDAYILLYSNIPRMNQFCFPQVCLTFCSLKSLLNGISARRKNVRLLNMLNTSIKCLWHFPSLCHVLILLKLCFPSPFYIVPIFASDSADVLDVFTIDDVLERDDVLRMSVWVKYKLKISSDVVCLESTSLACWYLEV